VRLLFDKILGNSVVLATFAILIGVAFMFLLILLLHDPRPGSEVVIRQDEDVGETPAPGELYPVEIRSIPVPFVSSDGTVQGYVFLDGTLEVYGKPARLKAGEVLGNIVMDFTAAIAQDGAGKATKPGEVDFDRLAGILLELAQQNIGEEVVVRAVVREPEEED